MAKIFISLGILFLVIGILLYLFKDFHLFKLPGDIYIQKGNFSFYFPITSSIIISILLSLIISFISKIK